MASRSIIASRQVKEFRLPEVLDHGAVHVADDPEPGQVLDDKHRDGDILDPQHPGLHRIVDRVDQERHAHQHQEDHPQVEIALVRKARIVQQVAGKRLGLPVTLTGLENKTELHQQISEQPQTRLPGGSRPTQGKNPAIVREIHRPDQLPGGPKAARAAGGDLRSAAGLQSRRRNPQQPRKDERFARAPFCSRARCRVNEVVNTRRLNRMPSAWFSGSDIPAVHQHTVQTEVRGDTIAPNIEHQRT